MLDLLEPDQPASIERDVFPRLVGNGLYGFVAEGYWLDIGTPERYLQGTFDILEGTVAHPGAGAHGRRASSCVARRRRERRAASSRPRSSRAAAASARAPASAPRAVLEHGRHGRATHRPSRARWSCAAREIGANCTLSGCIVGRRRADRRPHAHRGPGGARRGRDRSAPTTWSPTARGCSPASSSPTARSASRCARTRRSTAAAVAAVDPHRPGRPRSSISRPPARRAVAGRVRRPAPRRRRRAGSSSPGWAARRSAARLALAAARAARGPRPSSLARGYALPPWATRGLDRPVLELLRRHRGDARLLRRRAGRPARRRDRRHHRRAARRARARPTACPVIPLPGGFQPRAAVGYSTVVALEVAARRGRRPVAARGDRGGRRARRAPGRRVGARRARGGRGQGARAAPCTGTIPIVAGRRARPTPVAYRWKSPAQRERQAARLRQRAARARPQRDRGLEGGAELGRFAAVFLDDPEATHPRIRARIELTAELIGRGRRRGRAWSRAGATRAPSASCRSCCSATSSRSTSPCCAAPTRRDRRAPRAQGAVSLRADVGEAGAEAGGDPLGLVLELAPGHPQHPICPRGEQVGVTAAVALERRPRPVERVAVDLHHQALRPPHRVAPRVPRAGTLVCGRGSPARSTPAPAASARPPSASARRRRRAAPAERPRRGARGGVEPPDGPRHSLPLARRCSIARRVSPRDRRLRVTAPRWQPHPCTAARQTGPILAECVSRRSSPPASRPWRSASRVLPGVRRPVVSACLSAGLAGILLCLRPVRTALCVRGAGPTQRQARERPARGARSRRIR